MYFLKLLTLSLLDARVNMVEQLFGRLELGCLLDLLNSTFVKQPHILFQDLLVAIAHFLQLFCFGFQQLNILVLLLQFLRCQCKQLVLGFLLFVINSQLLVFVTYTFIQFIYNLLLLPVVHQTSLG